MRSSIILLCIFVFFSLIPPPPRSTLFPYTTLFRSSAARPAGTTLLTWLIPDFLSGLEYASHVWSRKRSRSEEHTSELQSRLHLVCRLLLEKKKNNTLHNKPSHLTKYLSVSSNVHNF